MVLPAILSNGARKLRVNIMLDPCSRGSYVSESAAEELKLVGQRQNLTIAGTGGTEVKKRSTRVQCQVSSIHGLFSAKAEAMACSRQYYGNNPCYQMERPKR